MPPGPETAVPDRRGGGVAYLRKRFPLPYLSPVTQMIMGVFRRRENIRLKIQSSIQRTGRIAACDDDQLRPCIKGTFRHADGVPFRRIARFVKMSVRQFPEQRIGCLCPHHDQTAASLHIAQFSAGCNRDRIGEASSKRPGQNIHGFFLQSLIGSADNPERAAHFVRQPLPLPLPAMRPPFFHDTEPCTTSVSYPHPFLIASYHRRIHQKQRFFDRFLEQC